MFTNVLKSAVIFLAAVVVTAGGSDWSSTPVKENLSRFCPVWTGQMGAHVCFEPVFPGFKKRAEDTGVEPATHCWAIDFESTC